MKKFFFDCGTLDATASLGIFVLRWMTGLMMAIGHGIFKIQHFSTLKQGFYVPDFFPLKFMSPSVSLMVCISVEVGASALIVLGLATRPAAFVLALQMVVIAFGLQGALPWFLGPSTQLAKEPALLYLIPLISIIFTGAGTFSMDARLYKEGKRRRW